MESATTAIADKDALEREQLRLTNDKIKIETDKLQKEMQPESWLAKLAKHLLAFGGLATIAATAYGIYDSYNKTIVDRERTQNIEQRTRFEDAIKKLETTTTISKLVGLSVLSGYLSVGSKIEQRQVLFTLAGLIATEKDRQTRSAILHLFERIPNDGKISPEEWSYFQDMLVTQNRALMGKDDLLHHRSLPSDVAQSEAEQVAEAVGRVISTLVRRGFVPHFSNYRAIYCARCDFRSAVFPNKADFTGAVLDNADFTGASLKEAVFDNAELLGSRFLEADLQKAQFRSLQGPLLDNASNDRSPTGHTVYIQRAVRTLDSNATIEIRMPNFSCANLVEADFSGHALFPGVMRGRSYRKGQEPKSSWYPKEPPFQERNRKDGEEITIYPLRVVPSKFFKSRLERTNFSQSEIFWTSEAGISDKFGYQYGFFEVAGIRYQQGTLGTLAYAEIPKTTDADKRDIADRELLLVDKFQQTIRGMYYGANTKDTIVSGELGTYLDGHAPEEDDFLSTFLYRIR